MSSAIKSIKKKGDEPLPDTNDSKANKKTAFRPLSPATSTR
jgi:hypothetical protein